MKRLASVVLVLTSLALAQSQSIRLVNAAKAQIGITRGYDGTYTRIAYPGGDVAKETGVCSDVLIRAFRTLDIDLQREVHEDMLKAFSAYPRRWGLKRPDSNIDHRRVPNLMAYFRRKGKELKISRSGADYLPGDIVAFDLGHGVTHIGIVSDETNLPKTRYKVVHNIGRGVEIEDMLFDFRIIGHYRYFA